MKRSATGERGQVLVMAVFWLPVLLAFAALVIDVGAAFLMKRHLQSAADAAALAAAQDLPDQVVAEATAHAYSASPSGKNERANSPNVTTGVSFPTSLKVKVTQSAQSPVYFAGILGFDGFDVSASAVASRISATTGTPMAVYVHELCGHKGFIAGGQNMLIEGGIHSNGNFEVKNQGFVSAANTTVYRPPHPNSPLPPGQPKGCVTSDQLDSTYCTECEGGPVSDPVPGRYRDWVTPYHTEAIMKSFTPCTITHSGDVKYENVAIPAGVHCLARDKKFTIAGSASGNITVIGGIIEIGGSGTLTPYNSEHPVLFYSTNTAGTAIKLNPSLAYDWEGYIINRLGGIEINAAGVTSPMKGLLEAEWIDINGENFKMLGTFNDAPSGDMFGGVTLEE